MRIVSLLPSAFAIATYERTLVPDQTPWDLFEAGNTSALTPDQQQGWTLLRDHTVCVVCHAPPLWTDNQFHNIGLRPWQEDPGLMDTTNRFSDRGLFKTPSLRGVGLRKGSLTHVGWITDTQDMLNFYMANTLNTGHVQFPENQDFRISRLLMPARWHANVTDFLDNGLTDPRLAAGTFPFDRPTLHSETISPTDPEIYGQGSVGSGGITPSLVAVTPLVINNGDFKVGVGGAIGGSSAIIVLSAGRAGANTWVSTIPVHVDLNLVLVTVVETLAGVGAGNGFATHKTPIGNFPAAVGASLYGQWLILDAANPDGVASTAGVHWTIH